MTDGANQEQADSTERKGWWGSKFQKLKSALSKTKTQIVGSIAGEETDGEKLEQEAVDPKPEIRESASSSSQLESEHRPKVKVEAAPQPDSAMPLSSVSTDSLDSDRSVEAQPDTRQRKEHPPSAVQVVSDMQAPVSVEASETAAPVKIDEEYLEELEEKLIKADLGLANAEALVEHLRSRSRGEKLTQKDILAFLRSEFLQILSKAEETKLSYKDGAVNIYLVVGVNGTGKTTSIGKLSWRMKQDGRKVLMAAGDTFRAAAESQLEIWSKRAGVDIVRLEDGADPGAVVYKALEKARSESYDCLVIDTAGRLHNKANLMDELKKIRGVIDKHGKDCSLESLLVLDASTGQNGLQQAKVFTEACKLTGVVLTKLDGSSKGGIVFSIARDLSIPVKLIGLGEQIDDLRDFEPEMFVDALF